MKESKKILEYKVYPVYGLLNTEKELFLKTYLYITIDGRLFNSRLISEILSKYKLE